MDTEPSGSGTPGRREDRGYPELLSRWAGYRSQLDADSIVRSVVERTLGDANTVRSLFLTYENEVPVALGLVAEHLRPGARVLEVGAGIGLVSRFLADQGFTVTAIEPAGDGFELMHAFAQAIDAHRPGPRDGSEVGGLSRVCIGVDDLIFRHHGPFGIAFSANVLEHVPDPCTALLAIDSVLAPDAVQVHLCPNYAFPYDPHFGIPLLPLAPRLTSTLLPRRIRTDGVWRSINFVTARQLRRCARRHGLALSFRGGVLADTVERFWLDDVFSSRHRRMAPALRCMRRLRVDALLRRVPPTLASPMHLTARSSGHRREFPGFRPRLPHA